LDFVVESYTDRRAGYRLERAQLQQGELRLTSDGREESARTRLGISWNGGALEEGGWRRVPLLLIRDL
jgi:hypothetical protein